MRFSYFPGCSLDSTARAYGESVEAVASALGMELVVVDDWNCCGATAFMAVDELVSLTLSARNLCQASKTGGPLVTPCSACFTNLRKTRKHMAEFPEVRTKVNAALAEAGLYYEKEIETKHLLEAVVEDIGLERLGRAVRRPLRSLRVAPYYGCQIARPCGIEGGVEDPRMLDRLLEALGATPTHFPMKTACCGGSLIGTREEVALHLCRNLLLCARQDAADCIAVVCPVCQINLDAYQTAVNRLFGSDFEIPVVYFTQLMGLALGLDFGSLGLRRCIVPAAKVFSRFAEERP